MSLLSYKIDNRKESLLALEANKPKQSKKSIKTSKKAIIWLKTIIKQYNINIHMGDDEGNGEYGIIGPNKRKIYFDGYCQNTNTVYEFHGCHYHNCRQCFPNSDINIYNKTLERENFIISKGYKLFRIWEHEFEIYILGKQLELGRYIK